MPYAVYGTAWKQQRTFALVSQALELGFRGLDSANFPASYDESLVGAGIANALEAGVKREDTWVSMQPKMLSVRSHGDTFACGLAFRKTDVVRA